MTMRLFTSLLLPLLLLSACLNEGGDDDDDAVSVDDDDTVETVLCVDYDGCDVNAACEDSVDGPVCTCESGWEGDGATCTDVNECAVDNGGCDADATCTNVDGSRDCECNDGFLGDGLTCQEELPTWELVSSFALSWVPNWAPDTVVAWGTSIVFGIETAMGTDSKMYRFDTADSAFTEIAGGTEELCACGLTQASTVLGDVLFLFGNGGQALDLSEASPSWQAVDYPEDRHRGEAGMTVFENSIFLFGGRGPLDSTQQYTGGLAGTWSDGAPIPYPVEFAQPVAVGDHIYLLGGLNETGDESRASRFTPGSNTWSALAPPPWEDDRTNSAGIIGDQLWMLGRGGLAFYDPTTDVWDAQRVPVPADLEQVRTVEIGGTIYAIGGVADTTEVHRLNIP